MLPNAWPVPCPNLLWYLLGVEVAPLGRTRTVGGQGLRGIKRKAETGVRESESIGAKVEDRNTAHAMEDLAMEEIKLSPPKVRQSFLSLNATGPQASAPQP